MRISLALVLGFVATSLIACSSSTSSTGMGGNSGTGGHGMGGNSGTGGHGTGGNGGGGHGTGGSGGMGGTGGSMTSTVCQALALNCPECEQSCGYIPITIGCKQGIPCPSQAQLCRYAENPAGYCTHNCTTNDDCPIEGGGLGTCTQINPNVSLCIVQ